MPGPPGPLLVVCALGVERFALRGARRAGAAGPVAVLRTGMGPVRARERVGGALRDPALAGAAVLVTGFCAGVGPRTAPGDVVVDDRADDTTGLAEAVARRLAGAGRAGRRPAVRTGRIAGSEHLVRGAERARWAAAGALAVDMESEAVLQAALAAGPRPVAAVRVVVDTPEYELARVATLRAGFTAFGVLRSLMPAFLDWHRSYALSWR